MSTVTALLVVLAVFAVTCDASFYGAGYGGLGVYGYPYRRFYGAGLYGRGLYGYGAGYGRGYYGFGKTLGLYGRRFGFY